MQSSSLESRIANRKEIKVTCVLHKSLVYLSERKEWLKEWKNYFGVSASSRVQRTFSIRRKSESENHVYGANEVNEWMGEWRDENINVTFQFHADSRPPFISAHGAVSWEYRESYFRVAVKNLLPTYGDKE